jgi:type II secretory pathway pseudopilin PulG
MPTYELQQINSYQLRIADCGLRILVPRSSNLAEGKTVLRAADPMPAGEQPACFNPQSIIRNPISRGLSLIEVVASTMIVGLMSVAALNSLGAATRSSESIGNRAVAQGLADELLAEVMQARYSDPNQTPVFGRESGEASTPRSAFDDIDDYDGWNKSPPQYRDGTAMPDRNEWRHRVEVRRVSPSDPTQTVGSDQGAKRICVIVEYRSEQIVKQFVVRTDTDEK